MGSFVNNKYIQFLMFLVTIYALIGDDIRLLAFDKDADDVFMWLNIITLSLFTIELVLSSIGVKGYLGSFFFWLDFLSTISIITDIEPLWQAIVSIGSNDEAAAAPLDLGHLKGDKEILASLQNQNIGVDANVTARAGKLTRIVRLIRLIRIVKLYKSASQHLEREESRKALKELVKSSTNINDKNSDLMTSQLTKSLKSSQLDK